MKKGLLIYYAKNKRNKNIGDYIQSLAARQFTGDDISYVEREQLNEYSGAPIKLIMNAWWMHRPENWPPSDKIFPMMTSIHINPSKADLMLRKEGIDYFKRNEPIGCRDKGTRLLESKGIKAYFSGCLTLTLGLSYKHNPIHNKVCFVDPYIEHIRANEYKKILQAGLNLILNYKTIRQITRARNKKITLKRLIQNSFFHKVYSSTFSNEILRGAQYSSHMLHEPSLGDEDSKFRIADNILKEYASSHLVVTSRIHAALPCVGIGTPVIYIKASHFDSRDNPDYEGRLDGLMEFLNVLEYKANSLTPYDNFNPKKIDYKTEIVNRNNHLNIKEELISSCRKFIKNEN